MAFKILQLIVVMVLARAHSAAALTPETLQVTGSKANAQLSQLTVERTLHASSGHLWFVNQEGLNRWNGYDMQVFMPDDGTGLTAGAVAAIFESGSGEIWVALGNSGLYRFDDASETFSYVSVSAPGEPDERRAALSIDQDAQGFLWVGHADGSITRLDARSGDAYHLDVATSRVDVIVASDDGKHMFLGTSADGVLVYSMAGERKGRFLVDTAAGRSAVRDLVVAGTRVWIAASNFGMGYVDIDLSRSTDEQFITPVRDTSLNDAIFNDLALDKEGDLWAATSRGLAYITEQQLTLINRDANPALLEDNLLSINFDRNDAMWLGSFIGVNLGYESLFTQYTASNGLAASIVTSFAGATDGTVWISSINGMLSKLDPKGRLRNISARNLFNIDTPDEIRVMSLATSGDWLYAGTQNNGLIAYNMRTEAVEQWLHDAGDVGSISANAVPVVFSGRPQELWIGTFGGGLNRLDTSTGKIERISSAGSAIFTDDIFAIEADAYDRLWIGTAEGVTVYRLDEGIFDSSEATPLNTTLGTLPILSIEYTADESIWVGTGQRGAARYALQTGQVTRISRDDGLRSSTVNAIRGASNGDVWLSTNSGLARWENTETPVRVYTVFDGLQSNEFNASAAYSDDDGRIFFGGPNGFNIVDQEGLYKRKSSPQVFITDIQVDYEPLAQAVAPDTITRVELPPLTNNIQISFALDDYLNPDGHRYRYRLSGFDESWVEAGTERVVKYTSLETGNYRLEVQGQGAGQEWGIRSKPIVIVQRPPFWATLWAYATYILLIAVSIYIAITYQQTQLRAAARREAELEDKVAQRTREVEAAREVSEQANAVKSQFLAAMSHEIRTPMNGIMGMTQLLLETPLSKRQKAYAASVLSSAGNMLDLINNILDFSKLEAGKEALEHVPFNLRQLLDEIAFMEADGAYAKDLEYITRFSHKVPEWIIGDPRKFRQIVNNLVTNAIKFTHSGSVTVSVSRKRDTITLSVTDTGIGMSSEESDRVFEGFTQADASTTRRYGGTGLGLSLVRQYVEMMGGTVGISSTPAVGSRIFAKLPCHPADSYADLPALDALAGYSVALDLSSGALTQQVTEQLERLGAKVADAGSAISDECSRHVLIVDESTADLHINTAQEYAHRLIAAPLRKIRSNEMLSGYRPFPMPPTLESVLAEISQDDVSSVPQARDYSPSPFFNTIEVLVVDDVAANQQIARGMLENIGARVSLASNGREAVEQWRELKPDVILMDCYMPEVDGFEATRLIRSHEATSGARPTPIVALTAADNSEDRARCVAQGMNAFVCKPYTTADLIAALTTCLADSNGEFRQSADATTNAQVDLQGPKDYDYDYDTDTGNDNDNDITDVIDLGVIKEIQSIDRDGANSTLSKAFSAFLTSAPQAIEALAAAARQQAPCSQIAPLAHTVKSSARVLGAVGVAKAVESVERDAKRGEHDSLHENALSAVDAATIALARYESTFRKRFLADERSST